jgi:peptidylamidoglycolate lyase
MIATHSCGGGRRLLATLCVVCGFGLFSQPALLQQQKGGEGEETGPYDVVANWPQPFARPGYVQGSQGGVFAESSNRIFLANRGELKLPEALPTDFNGAWGSLGQRATLAPTPDLRNCIVVVDASGKLIESWTQHDHLFQGGRGPHKVRISPYDPERHVWVVDDGRHQVFKFTNDGKALVMALGEAGVPGNDNAHFARPTDIAWLPDGTFFVTDGYINTRVVKFDKNGKFLMTWGTPGKGHGQFDLPHAIDIDRNRRLYVADRSNERIQVFDENGKFIDEWPNIRSASHIMVSADQFVWVSDVYTNKMLKYDMNGRLLYYWGVQGTFAGGLWGIHQFSVDPQGNLYIAETYGGRTQKFKPKPNADKSKLMGVPIALAPKAAAR